MVLICAQPVPNLGVLKSRKNDIDILLEGTEMSVKLVDQNNPTTINIHDMKDGDIGEIVDWPVRGCIGRVVQRYKDYLLTVGQESGNGWGKIFSTSRDEGRIIRLLQPGEMLEIV